MTAAELMDRLLEFDSESEITCESEDGFVYEIVECKADGSDAILMLSEA